MTHLELVCALLALSSGGFLILLLITAWAYLDVRDHERFWKDAYIRLRDDQQSRQQAHPTLSELAAGLPRLEDAMVWDYGDSNILSFHRKPKEPGPL